MKIRFFVVFTLAILSGFVFSCNTAPNNNNKTSNVNISPKPSQSAASSPTGTLGTRGTLQLIDRIEKLQARYVGESHGSEGDEGFTRDDFKKFKDDNIPAKIVQDLKQDNDFALLVQGIKAMPVDERQELLETARTTYKKTWRELGRDPKATSTDKLRQGQTDAGQEAEKLIAEAVVNLVNNLLGRA